MGRRMASIGAQTNRLEGLTMSARRDAMIAQEQRKIIATLGSPPYAKCRAVTAVARIVLLNAPYLYAGEYFNVKGRYLGAGVYELSRIGLDD